MPAITGGPHAAALTEDGSGQTATDILSVADSDLSDVVTGAVASVAETGTFSGTNPLSNATLEGYMSVTTTVIDGLNTTGNLVWTFNSGSETFAFLGAGETLILTYTLSATDDAGTPASDTETVDHDHGY